MDPYRLQIAFSSGGAMCMDMRASCLKHIALPHGICVSLAMGP